MFIFKAFMKNVGEWRAIDKPDEFSSESYKHQKWKNRLED